MDVQRIAPVPVEIPEKPYYKENVVGRLRKLPHGTYLKTSYDDLNRWAILPKPCKIMPGVTSINSPSRIGTLQWMVVTSPYPIAFPEIVTGTPQFITPGFEWAVCIKRNLDSTSFLPFTPGLDDCPLLRHSAINIELRILARVHFECFETMAGTLGGRTKKFLLNHPHDQLVTAQVSELRNLMFQALRMLGVSNLYPEILLDVTAFQRSYIDLQAFLDNEEKHKPRLSAPDVMPWPLDKSLMGGITENETEASNLYIMGIPFWLVRPAQDVCTSPDTLISLEVDFEPPAPQIELQHFSPPFPPVFEGYPHRDMQRATQRIRRHWAEYVLPSRIITHQEYEPPAAAGPSELAYQVQQPLSSNRSSRSSKSSKAKHTHPPPPPPSFDPFKYLTPEDSHFPRMLHWWKTAIQAIEPIAKHPLRTKSGIGYFLPDPKLFALDCHRSVYQVTWLAICAAHLHAVHSNQFTSANNQHWRLALYRFRTLLDGSPDPGAPVGQPITAAAPDKDRIARTMNPQLESMLALFQTVSSVQWFASVFPVAKDLLRTGLPDTVSAEVYWEITEVSFRLELAHLDRYLLPDVYKDTTTGNARDLLVHAVFPMTEGNTVVGEYSLPQYPNWNGGMASTDLTEFIHAISAFRDLVKAWPNCPAAILSSTGQYPTPGAVAHMATLVARFYKPKPSTIALVGPPVVPHSLPPSALAHSAPRDSHVEVAH
ncbi:hypothetical protein BKA70DRAFT_1449242 [Coprinopsis sp. MPI-PUGE-AT-0042]|nr:hypothetical protein BKA70DRAFT_1449242 [Coprinopsis sp. MPI-PUGE-AT-0042]